jgi:uncharacterized membrane protein (DUF485 family)
MSKSSARRERLGWLLTGIVVSAYVIFVAVLGFFPRHQPELVANSVTITIPMTATIIFIAALVVVTSFYLHHSRDELDDSERATTGKHRP